MIKYSSNTSKAVEEIKAIQHVPQTPAKAKDPSAARIRAGEKSPAVSARPYPILPPEELDALKAFILEVLVEVGLAVRSNRSAQATDLHKSGEILAYDIARVMMADETIARHIREMEGKDESKD
jgi:trimethylamine:corrinoid methyltransferase-like protein